MVATSRTLGGALDPEALGGVGCGLPFSLLSANEAKEADQLPSTADDEAVGLCDVGPCGTEKVGILPGRSPVVWCVVHSLSSQFMRATQVGARVKRERRILFEGAVPAIGYGAARRPPPSWCGRRL